MNSDKKSKPSAELHVDGDTSPAVPVFSCVVHLTGTEQGVHARVANLEGLECEAANERAALAQLVPAFKKRITKFLQDGDTIPWVDPVPALSGNQQQRLIPVHL